MKTSVFFTSLYDYYTMILFNASSSCFILLFKIISGFSHAGQNLSQSLLEYSVQTLSSVSSVKPFLLEILKREMLAQSMFNYDKEIIPCPINNVSQIAIVCSKVQNSVPGKHNFIVFAVFCNVIQQQSIHCLCFNLSLCHIQQISCKSNLINCLLQELKQFTDISSFSTRLKQNHEKIILTFCKS